MRMSTIAVVVALFAPALAASAQGISAWEAVDRHALAAPAAATASVDKLAAYLSDGMGTDAEKARAAFRWVTDSIAYDTSAFFSGRHGDESAGGVLGRRSAVCAGYSRLYADLCGRMGLTVEVVRGYAKGYGYSPGAIFTDTNHDWNAVMIDGAWRLVDCTWGAGHVSGSHRFVKKLTDYFFFSSPRTFILSHLPEDARWQLLTPAWSREQFLDSVFVYPSAYTLGITPRTHARGVFASPGAETLAFEAAEDIVATASVDDNDDLALTQLVDGGFEVRCVFAGPGRHSVMIYASRRQSADDGFEAVLQYAVQVDKGLGPGAGLPTTWNNYCRRRVALEAPFSRVLSAGSPVPFAVTIPGATKVAVISGKAWSYLGQEGDRFTGTVTVEPGSVQVCAKFAGSGSFEGILGYEAK